MYDYSISQNTVSRSVNETKCIIVDAVQEDDARAVMKLQSSQRNTQIRKIESRFSMHYQVCAALIKSEECSMLFYPPKLDEWMVMASLSIPRLNTTGAPLRAHRRLAAEAM